MRRNRKGGITVISGPRECGKTTLCKQIIHIAHQKNLQCKGIISTGIYKGKNKIGIRATSIKDGDTRILAHFSPGWDVDYPKREWQFNKYVFTWGNGILKDSIPTDILIIDELGYLEFEKNAGWSTAFAVISSFQYEIAYVVIRSIFFEKFFVVHPNAEIIDLTNEKSKNMHMQIIAANFDAIRNG